jgi:hypothetical protein
VFEVILNHYPHYHFSSYPLFRLEVSRVCSQRLGPLAHHPLLELRPPSSASRPERGCFIGVVACKYTGEKRPKRAAIKLKTFVGAMIFFLHG